MGEQTLTTTRTFMHNALSNNNSENLVHAENEKLPHTSEQNTNAGVCLTARGPPSVMETATYPIETTKAPSSTHLNNYKAT